MPDLYAAVRGDLAPWMVSSALRVFTCYRMVEAGAGYITALERHINHEKLLPERVHLEGRGINYAVQKTNVAQLKNYKNKLPSGALPEGFIKACNARSRL